MDRGKPEQRDKLPKRVSLDSPVTDGQTGQMEWVSSQGALEPPENRVPISAWQLYNFVTTSQLFGDQICKMGTTAPMIRHGD